MGIRDKRKPEPKSQVIDTILPDIDINNYIYEDTEPGEEVSCINIGGKLVASLGNVITITGKPKSRKTTFLQAFLASFLSG